MFVAADPRPREKASPPMRAQLPQRRPYHSRTSLERKRLPAALPEFPRRLWLQPRSSVNGSSRLPRALTLTFPEPWEELCLPGEEGWPRLRRWLMFHMIPEQYASFLVLSLNKMPFIMNLEEFPDLLFLFVQV